MLDALLAPALQLEQLPVIPERRRAEEIAAGIVGQIEALVAWQAAVASEDRAGQLGNVIEALSLCAISLVAYSRGRMPRVKAPEPNVDIIEGV